MNSWIDSTWAKHKVNVVAFAEDWVDRFYHAEDTWPASHRRKTQDSWHKYDYEIKGIRAYRI